MVVKNKYMSNYCDIVWGVKEVQRFTGLSRKATIQVLNRTDAPTLPRAKGQTFRVPSEAFKRWWGGGSYEAITEVS